MYRCRAADNSRILEYISKEPEMNLFIFGDMENYGADNEPVSVYAMERDGEWDCIILQFFDSYIVYSQNEGYDKRAVADFLKDREPDCISGKESLLEGLPECFLSKKAHSTYMCRCNMVQSEGLAPLPDGAVLRELKKEDIDGVTKLFGLIEEFDYQDENVQQKAKQRLLAELEHGSVVYGVYIGSLLVSCAQTSAVNSQSAMIVGVATHPDYRGRGFASNVVARLCEDSLKGGRQFLCLFYDNPDAGRIYHRIGFDEVGKYTMIK